MSNAIYPFDWTTTHPGCNPWSAPSTSVSSGPRTCLPGSPCTPDTSTGLSTGAKVGIGIAIGLIGLDLADKFQSQSHIIVDHNVDIKHILPNFVSTVYYYVLPPLSGQGIDWPLSASREVSSTRLLSATVGNAICNLIRDLKTFLVLVLNIY
ncbi:hypothetical protein BDR22DRAFT_234859 [Usnea florida]